MQVALEKPLRHTHVSGSDNDSQTELEKYMVLGQVVDNRSLQMRMLVEDYTVTRQYELGRLAIGGGHLIHHAPVRSQSLGGHLASEN